MGGEESGEVDGSECVGAVVSGETLGMLTEGVVDGIRLGNDDEGG